MVTGNVNKISKGFRKALSKDKTKATSKEVVKLVTVTPGKNPAIKSTNKAVVNKRISNCMS
jgi:phage head maturation protease